MRKPSVLIVDDQQNWLEVLQDLLLNAYEVRTARSYDEALQILKRKRRPFDAVVVDICLDENKPRDEKGLDLLEFIRHNLGIEVGTVALTGYSTTGKVKRAISECGVCDYLEKNPEGEKILDRAAFQKAVNKAIEWSAKRRSRLVFVLMPFAKKYEAIYDIIKGTIEKTGLDCRRADDFFQPRRIIEDIRKCIQIAKFVVADLSGRNANVFYEIGMAHALGQTVLLLTQNMDDVPPKLRDVRCIPYQDTVEGASRLREALTRAVQDLQERDFCPEPIFKKESYELDQKLCFVLMPPTDLGQRAYEHIIKKVVADSGLACLDAQSVFSTKHVMDEIWEQLNRACIIIADLSGKDPDVFYLTGMSHGLEKKVILLARSEEDIPFDLRGPSHVFYSDQTIQKEKETREKLDRVLRQLLNELPCKPSPMESVPCSSVVTPTSG